MITRGVIPHCSACSSQPCGGCVVLSSGSSQSLIITMGTHPSSPYRGLLALVVGVSASPQCSAIAPIALFSYPDPLPCSLSCLHHKRSWESIVGVR